MNRHIYPAMSVLLWYDTTELKGTPNDQTTSFC